MKFNIHERILMLGSLGMAQGNLSTLRIVRDLQGELSFSEEESAKLGLAEKDGQITWADNVPPKDIKIGPAGLEAALGLFRKMDSEEKLTFEVLPLYERLLEEQKAPGLGQKEDV